MTAKTGIISSFGMLLGMARFAAPYNSDAATSKETFAVETFVGRTYNYLDNLVDKDGLPYFNVFWTDPAEAAHDWPDFGDVMSRQLQAAVMARHLTGIEARNEKLWTQKVLSYLDPKTKLLIRPKTSFSEPVADLGDQALTLYALVTVYADEKKPELKAVIDQRVAHLPGLYEPNHWLYQQEYMMEKSEPAPATLHLDDGSLDFWFLR